METVIIEEVQGRAKQGLTEPFICLGDDGARYFVKGIGAGRRSQICEWVSAQLATAFGLPIADYVLAEVPVELLALQVRSDIGQLGAGIVFASRQITHAQELSVTTRDLVPAEVAMDILVFDWWIHNEDRHLTERGGNPNLLWDVRSAELAVIDHNQAFDPGFDTAHFLGSHVFAEYWNKVFSDHVERRKYSERLNNALSGLTAIRATIPESWWHLDEGVPANVSWDEIASCLKRCQRNDFWDTP
jgi:hypothetical protein